MTRANSVSRRQAAGAPPDPRIERWIGAQLGRAALNAKSLIVTVWGDAIAPHGGAVWLSGLIRLLKPFGISERLARTSVYRLVQEGWLEVKPVGRQSLYRLSAEGGRRFEAAYRRIYAHPNGEWNGDWDLVIVAQDALDAATRKALRRELGWLGFGALGRQLLVRPSRGNASERAGVQDVVRSLGATDAVSFVTGQEDTASRASFRAQAASSWRLQRIATDYRTFFKQHGTVVEVFAQAQASPQQAFVVRTLLIHSFRRVMLHDPQLPPALLPARWPGAAAYALCRDFYRRSQAQAEIHLLATLRGERGGLPPATREFYRRFGGLERIARARRSASGPPSPARRL